MIQNPSTQMNDPMNILQTHTQRRWLHILSVVVLFVVSWQNIALANDPETDIQQRITEICSNLQNSTVRIRSGSDVFSGVLVSRSGLVLTVAHGLKTDASATVIFLNGRSIEAKRIVVDDSSDVALLSFDVKSMPEVGWSTVPVSQGDPSEAGNIVLAGGLPARENDGNKTVVRLGEILACDDTAIKTTCTLTSGDSGGPLVNSRGELIGLNRQIGIAAESNGHIALPTIHRALKDTDDWKKLTQQVHAERTPILSTDALRIPPAVVNAARLVTVEVHGTDSKGVTAVRACGVILDDHHVATKLSEIVSSTELECRFADGSTIGGALSKSDRPNDLAILKLESPCQSGSAIRATMAKPRSEFSLVGSVVYSATSPKDVTFAGIVSRDKHQEPSLPTRFGATMQEDGERVRIAGLSPNGSAVLAGLQVGDELLQIDGTAASTLMTVGNLLKPPQPGDWIVLDVKRGETEFRVQAQMQHDPGQQFEKTEFLDGRVGRVSERRSSFRAIQHDLVIDPAACGGPLLDIDGNVIAINIARRARESTLAIPIDIVLRFAAIGP